MSYKRQVDEQFIDITDGDTSNTRELSVCIGLLPSATCVTADLLKRHESGTELDKSAKIKAP